MTCARDEKKPLLARAGQKLQSLWLSRKGHRIPKTNIIEGPSSSVLPNVTTNHQIAFRFSDLPVEIKLMVLECVIAPGKIYLEPYTQRWGFGRLKVACAYRTLTSTRKPTDQLPEWVHKLERVHLKTPPKQSRRLGGSPLVKQPGFGLMATERLMYEEGHPIFYGENEFHVAPGPISITSRYFFDLQAKHRDMIRKLVIKLTIADLTPEGFQHVEWEVRDRMSRSKHDLRSMSRNGQVRVWVASCMATLELLWEQKLDWLHTLPKLSDLTITGQERKLDFGQERLGAERPLSIVAVNRPDFPAFFISCRTSARRTLSKEFNSRGRYTSPSRLSSDNPGEPMWVMDVEGTKDWLAGWGPGVRYKS
ncbi:hypothetical protein N7G274_006211 [Stereocaulon virgatum]|uniref:Uncharacterized protein n=1 Tax=Stereocaulon virgatum TaxID=373712 RepID=A0ABR4A8M9_9LECA